MTEEEQTRVLALEVKDKLHLADEETLKIWVLAIVKVVTEIPVVKSVDILRTLKSLLEIKEKVDDLDKEEDKKTSERIREAKTQ